MHVCVYVSVCACARHESCIPVWCICMYVYTLSHAAEERSTISSQFRRTISTYFPPTASDTVKHLIFFPSCLSPILVHTLNSEKWCSFQSQMASMIFFRAAGWSSASLPIAVAASKAALCLALSSHSGMGSLWRAKVASYAARAWPTIGSTSWSMSGADWTEE